MGRFSHRFLPLRVCGQFGNHTGIGLCVKAALHKAVDPVLHQQVRSAVQAGEHRQAKVHGLQQHHAENLIAGGQHKQVGPVVQFMHLALGHPLGVVDPVPHAKLFGVGKAFIPVGRLAFSHQRQAQAGHGFGRLGQHLEQKADVPPLFQHADVQQLKVLPGRSSRPGRRVIGGLQRVLIQADPHRDHPLEALFAQELGRHAAFGKRGHRPVFTGAIEQRVKHTALQVVPPGEVASVGAVVQKHRPAGLLMAVQLPAGQLVILRHLQHVVLPD